MPRPAPLRPADLRGALRLATEATAGLADLVEALHERIARLPGLGAASADGRTGGVTGLVYRTIRATAHAVGGGLDALVGRLAPALATDASPPAREAVVAALNGVLGDHLAATDNPLAIPMTLRQAGRPLVIERAALAQRLPQAGGDLLVLLHGLCMNDLQWSRAGHDHGAALERAGGFTPLYLNYNSGLHVSTNGRALAQLLEQLLAQWPQPVQRLVLLGHSMGGLLARSAVHAGRQARQHWPARLDDLVFLGTPHHGAPLERAGHGVDRLLAATPYTAPLARLGRLRSAGITDLRHGNLLDEDWIGHDRFAHGADARRPLPLPAGVRSFAIAGCLGPSSTALKARLLGDGLVPVDSALGLHADPARALAFPAERQWVAQGFGHLDLLGSAEVAAQLRRWLAPTRPARPAQENPA
jgi:hypothetical protein